MIGFESILVHQGVHDPKNCAIEQAIRLVRGRRANVEIIDVFDELPMAFARLMTAMRIEDLKQLAIADRRRELEMAARKLRDEGAIVKVTVVWGKPFAEIIRAATGGGHDLVINAEPRGVGMGYTTTRLLRMCPVPVLVSRPIVHERSPRVLAAVDPSFHDEHGPTLNDDIVATAAWFAERFGAELHIVHGWRTLIQSGVHVPKRFRGDELDRFLHETEDRHAGWLELLLRRTEIRLPRKQIHVVEGDATNVVVDVVESLGIDLLVMGTVRDTDLAGLYLGATAESIVDQVSCSVVARKPRGFAPPLATNRELRGENR